MMNGDEGDRTLDLGVANAALSQLSYIPTLRWGCHIKFIGIGQFKKTRRMFKMDLVKMI
jgi:hypothetical protein